LIALLVTALIFTITNPYTVFDFSSFKNTLQYESNVALGSTAVFYTQEFFNTIPVLFHFQHVYPFLLNPILTILFIPSFLYVIIIALKTNNKNYLLLAICFLLLFTSQALLFVKWTRYMVPTIPFIYLIIAIALTDTIRSKIKKLGIKYLVLSIISTICFLFAFSYYQTVLIQPDTRIAAANWAKKNTSYNAEVASEIYDLGIIPFNNIYQHITLCNNYNLENNPLPCDNRSLQVESANSNYIILPSERILKTRLINSNQFPKGYKFYHTLLNKTNDFQLIYKTPCDVYCKILYLNDHLFSFEQTANVFDRPTVYIFERNISKFVETY
jgi:hypothetical protein